MAKKHLFVKIIMCTVSLISADLAPVSENNKIKITTGTGSFCPWTVDFITNQLVPTYEVYKDFLEIEFIPWGRATYNDDRTVTCNQGHTDCWANRLHRCVLDLLKDDQDARMRYMACEFSLRSAFLMTSYECVEQIGLNLVVVDYCVNNALRDNLDAIAAEAAAEALQTINAIPFILFNDEANSTLHYAARPNLPKFICLSLIDIPETGLTECPEE